MSHKPVSVLIGPRHGYLLTILAGYKLCTHISKALKARSKAIQRALHIYNQAAQNLNPPRHKLTWDQIVEYTTLAEFELLRSGAREDIRNLEWANIRNREATVCHLKMLRAEEEIQRLNVEVKRLATWIMDDRVNLKENLERCQQLWLSNAIAEFADEQNRINTNLQRTLQHIYSLHGFCMGTWLCHYDIGIK
jgi:hypothetical protein